MGTCIIRRVVPDRFKVPNLGSACRDTVGKIGVPETARLFRFATACGLNTVIQGIRNSTVEMCFCIRNFVETPRAVSLRRMSQCSRRSNPYLRARASSERAHWNGRDWWSEMVSLNFAALATSTLLPHAQILFGIRHPALAWALRVVESPACRPSIYEHPCSHCLCFAIRHISIVMTFDCKHGRSVTPLYNSITNNHSSS